MGNWSIYRPAFTVATQVFREGLRQDKKECERRFGQPLKRVPYERLEEEAWKLAFTHRLTTTAPLAGAALLDEWLWREEGRHILFPVPGLLPRLYRARIDVTVDEFKMPMPTFILAMPAEEKFGGLCLPGCLVGSWNPVTKAERVSRISKQLGMDFDYEIPDAKEVANEGLFFTVTHLKEGSVTRWSIPHEKLKPLLACNPDAPEQFADLLGRYEGIGPFEMDVTADEVRMQYRLTKLLVALCIYLRACPDAVTDGVPPPALGLVPRFSVGHELGRKHVEDEDRASPIGHWREWHFRRYPKNMKTGARREGVVFVTGSWVSGREHLHTVEERNATGQG